MLHLASRVSVLLVEIFFFFCGLISRIIHENVMVIVTYTENLTIELYVIDILNMHVKFLLD